MKYTAPTVAQLMALKTQLGFTSAQMAQAFGVSSDAQWRKYVGGENVRALPLQRAFFMSALQVLSDDELERVRVYMASFGARWERDGDQLPPA